MSSHNPHNAVKHVDATRSRIMRSVRQAHTGPELVVRKVLHGLGLRFRLQRRDLPGTPDVVLPRHRTAIFVHGCFWHRHPCCGKATLPKTRVQFWRDKFDHNIARDRKNEADLIQAGWRVLTIWECETRDPDTLATVFREKLLISAGEETAEVRFSSLDAP